MRFMKGCDYSNRMSWLAPGLLLVGLLLSLPLTATMVGVGRRLRALDSSGAAGHQKQLRAVPNIGGVAIVMAFVLPLSGGLLVAAGALPISPEDVWKGSGAFSERLRQGQSFGWMVVAAATWLLVAGAVDDRRAMGPGLKLLLQTLPAVAVTWLGGVRPDLGAAGPAGAALSIAVGTLWIVLLVNAMNFLDNMDGLAGGVGAIAALLFMVSAMMASQWFVAGLFGLLAGALLGFLCFNFLPRGGARIFMGDGGSQPLGLLLAVLAMRCVFTDPSDPHYALGTRWYGALAPVVVLSLPLYDLLATSAVRLRQGRSPFVGDQQHLSHRLVQRGFSRRGAVLFVWALAAVVGVGGVSLGSLAPWQAALVGVQTMLALAVLAAAEGLFRA
jgi:UDP-GlcNAc:undecaprenyl-phosphate GlcNAc-1-phosphate transferase